MQFRVLILYNVTGIRGSNGLSFRVKINEIETKYMIRIACMIFTGVDYEIHVQTILRAEI